jgi:peptidyl-prolyl cis-trans isomerase C
MIALYSMLSVPFTLKQKGLNVSILIGLTGALILAFFPGCMKEEKGAGEPTVAVVQGEPITKKELEREIRRLDKSFSLETSHDEDQNLSREVLNQMIRKKLLLIEAKNMGITLTPEQASETLSEQKGEITQVDLERMLKESGIPLEQWEKMVLENRTIDLLIKQRIDPKIQITEEELIAEYQNNLEEFQEPERVKVRQIVLSNKNDALLARMRLVDGKEDFGLVAQEVSLSPDAAQGGAIGTFSKGEMPPEFDEVCFSLLIGEISYVVKSPFGYHIFLVEERLPSGILSFKEARKMIYTKLFTQQKELAFNEYQEEIWKRSEITVLLKRRES